MRGAPECAVEGGLVTTGSFSEGGTFELRHKDGEEGGLVESKVRQSAQGKGGSTCKALWQEGGSACLVRGEQTAGVKGEMSLKKWATP